MRVQPSEQVCRLGGFPNRTGHRHRIIDTAYSVALPTGLSAGRALAPPQDCASFDRLMETQPRYATAAWLAHALGQYRAQAPEPPVAAAAYAQADGIAGLAITPGLPGASVTV